MYENRSWRFLLGIVVIVVLIGILLIVILTHKPAPIKQQKPMAAYANNPTVQVAMLVDGPVNAVSLHNQVLVVISNSQTTFKIFQGYNDHIIKEKTYPMTDAAFHVFLRSLESANFNLGHTSPGLSQASGFCPTGDRFIFTYDRNGQQIERYWSTSCGGVPHTFDGNLGLTEQLFVNQVPDYSNMISNLNL